MIERNAAAVAATEGTTSPWTPEGLRLFELVVRIMEIDPTFERLEKVFYLAFLLMNRLRANGPEDLVELPVRPWPGLAAERQTMELAYHVLRVKREKTPEDEALIACLEKILAQGPGEERNVQAEEVNVQHSTCSVETILLSIFWGLKSL